MAAVAVASIVSVPSSPAGAQGEVAWPGAGPAVVVDGSGALGTNLSGLAPAGPSSLWAVRDAPGSLLALDRVDGRWTPRTGWGDGRSLRYPDGQAGPDAEAVTVASADPVAVYVGAERDNRTSGTARNSVLRYEPVGEGALIATHEWRLDALAPGAGANTGIEGLAWIGDDVLVTSGLRDDRGRAYVPAEHPAHHGGLFAVAFEQRNEVQFVLLAEGGDVTRIATVPVALRSVMELHWDAEHGELWAACDDTCGGRTALLRPRNGAFETVAIVGPPAGGASRNDEGLARLACEGSVSRIVRSDDAATGGHALREAELPCRSLAALVAPGAVAPATTAASAASAAQASDVSGTPAASAGPAGAAGDGAGPFGWAVVVAAVAAAAIAAGGVSLVVRRSRAQRSTRTSRPG